MVIDERIQFTWSSVDLVVYFDAGICALIGYNPKLNKYNVAMGQSDQRLIGDIFRSNDISGPYYGFSAMFKALHEKLDEMGLEGFPKDPAYVLDKLKNPPPQIEDLGMSDEDYLAQLAEQQGQRC